MSRLEYALGRRSRGNALIEFVLILPLFLMVFLGAVDWGWYFVVREIAVNATRQGARVGSAAPEDRVIQDARAAVETYLGGALGLAKDEIKGLDVSPSTCGAYACITVALTAFPVVADRPTSSLSGLVAWTRVPATVTAQTQMRLEIQP